MYYSLLEKQNLKQLDLVDRFSSFDRLSYLFFFRNFDKKPDQELSIRIWRNDQPIWFHKKVGRQSPVF
jgi:hypothetical protein